MDARDAEIDNLKTIIIALNQKVKAKDDLEEQLAALTETHKSTNQAREELRIQLEDASNAFAEEHEKKTKFQELVIEENKNRQESENQKDEAIGNLENQL